MGEHPSDEHVVCDVCRDGGWTEQNMIVFCEGPCGVTVHQKCYGVLEIPEGDIPWYCDVCTPSVSGRKPQSPTSEHFCILCLGRGGAMKEVQPESKRWVHVSCAMAAPEIYFHDTKRLLGVDGIDSLALSRRRKLGCSFCDRPNGMCVQCSGPSCEQSFHVRCGQDSGLKVELKPKASRKRAYCAEHLYLFGQHEALSDSRNSPRQSGASQPYTTSGFSCGDLWNEVSEMLDAESTMVEFLKGSSSVKCPFEVHIGAKRGRRNYEKEKVVELLNLALQRELISLPLQETDMQDKACKAIKRRKGKVANPDQRSWVKAQYKVQSGAKSSAKTWYNPKTPFSFRCTLEDTPEISKALSVLSLQGTVFVEPKQGNWAASGNDSLEQELWRLRSCLKSEEQANRLRVHKINNILQPSRMQPVLRTSAKTARPRNSVRPRKAPAAQKRASVETEKFLGNERSFMETLAGLKRASKPALIDKEIRLVVEYMVCKVASFSDSRKNSENRRNKKRKSSHTRKHSAKSKASVSTLVETSRSMNVTEEPSTRGSVDREMDLQVGNV